MKQCQKSGKATQEMRLRSLCSVLGNCRDTDTETPFMSPAAASDTCTSACCESAEAGRRPLRSPDLEFETEIPTSIALNLSTEASSSSVEVMAAEKPKITTPSAAELEEFFTEAEEYVQKRFAEKYNYDIKKDAPKSEGSYHWLPTHI